MNMLTRQEHANLWLEIQSTLMYGKCTPEELAKWLRDAADFLEADHGPQ